MWNIISHSFDFFPCHRSNELAKSTSSLSLFFFLLRRIVSAIIRFSSKSACYNMSYFEHMCMFRVCVCVSSQRSKKGKTPSAGDQKQLLNIEMERSLWKGRGFRCDVHLYSLVFGCLLITSKTSFLFVTSVMSHTH